MLSIHEQALGARVEKDADRFMKIYKPQMDILEKSPLAKVKSLTPYDYYVLGKQLEAWEIYKSICEDDGTLAALGKIPDVAFDVVSVAYGTSPLGVIASVQPIDEENGTVYYKKIVAQTTRGNVTAGDDISNPRAAADSYPRSFASECVTDETVDTTSYGTLSYSATLSLLPIRPYTMSVTATIGSTVLTATDNGSGVLNGYDIQGTINYTSGAIVVEFANDPGDGNTIYVSYHQDMEAASDIPKIIMKLDSKNVHACVYALKDTIGLESSYALRRRFGIIAEDEVAMDLISAINSELMNTMVYVLSQNYQGSYTWDNTKPTGVSYHDHKRTFKDAIMRAEVNMLGNAGRGTVSVMVAGRNACSIIGTLDGFVKVSDGNMLGAHIYGTLDGITVIRVPANAVLDANHVYCLYKGMSPFEAAVCYAPYMPLVITTALPTGANPLLNQKAAAVWAAIEALVPNFITRIVISNF